jgi:L-rhamnonate dehydratase
MARMRQTLPALEPGKFMKIARVTAHALNPPVPIKASGIDRTVNRPIVFVEIETDTGIVGHGITSLAPAKGAAALIANTVTPLILGMDARRIADVWNAMYRELGHRGQTGLAYHAISAIDIALWDIRGKALKEPVWRLLGGARDKVPCYVTMGLPSMDRDQLASVAKDWISQGMGGV